MVLYYKQFKPIFFTFFVLTFIFYLNTLKNKYALDDEYITVTNIQEKGKNFYPNHELVSKGFKGIPKIWKSRYAKDGESTFDYRPFTTTTFAIEYGLFGQNPFISHLINLLIYSLTIWVVFCILYKLFEFHEYNFQYSFICSLLFLIHPIHTEVVNNLKCRDELMAFLFVILALWFSLKTYENFSVKNIVLIVLFLCLGLLSKRSAMLGFAIIPLCIILFRKIEIKKIIFTLSFVFVIQFIFHIIKNGVTEKSVRYFHHFENPLYIDHVSFFQKILIGIKTLGFYVKFLFVPYPFRFYYGVNTFDLYDIFDIYFFIGLSSIFISLFLLLKSKNKILLFAFLLFFGCISPFLNISTPAPGIIAERFAYFSSFGFCLIITFFFTQKFPNINYKSFKDLFKKPIIYLLPLLLIFLIMINNRNSKWHTKIELYENDIKYLEHSAKANSLLGNEYFEMLRNNSKKYPFKILIDKCLNHYSLAAKADSSIFTAYNNAGVIYFDFLGDIKTAKKKFELAIRHRPLYAQAYENLGNCYKNEKNFTKAFECYKKSIEIKPKQYSAYIAAINLFFELKKYKNALALVKVGQSEFPNDYQLTVFEANSYLSGEQREIAVEKFEEAYRLNPNIELRNFIDNLDKSKLSN